METTSVLREIVAGLTQLDIEQVSVGLDLRSRLQNSLSRGRLDAAIRRRLNVTCPEVYTAKTFGELEAAVFGQPLVAVESNLGKSVTNSGTTSDFSEANHRPAMSIPMVGLQCGIDVESPEDLPPATDYWESDFYRSHFTPAEIAYCIAQQDSRQHFAARWCAKEALKKCDSAYMSIAMNQIEISHDAMGKPKLVLLSDSGPTLLPVAISLSHSKSMAIAIVIMNHIGARDSSDTQILKPTTIEQLNSGSNGMAFDPPKRGWFRRLFGI